MRPTITRLARNRRFMQVGVGATILFALSLLATPSAHAQKFEIRNQFRILPGGTQRSRKSTKLCDAPADQTVREIPLLGSWPKYQSYRSCHN
ncbi:MAG: hypothetical protein IH849_03595 [Acidobacteria bacterium]|nr:hypothetical protein [Acidobacteriota bacterium]